MAQTIAILGIVSMFLLIPVNQAFSIPVTIVYVYICYPSASEPLCIDSLSPCVLDDCWMANVTNSASTNLTAVVMDSIQNYIGQTVGITTTTINVPPKGNATAYLFTNDFLAEDNNYCMNVFAISLAGGSLSPPAPPTCFYFPWW